MNVTVQCVERITNGIKLKIGGLIMKRFVILLALSFLFASSFIVYAQTEQPEGMSIERQRLEQKRKLVREQRDNVDKADAELKQVREEYQTKKKELKGSSREMVEAREDLDLEYNERISKLNKQKYYSNRCVSLTINGVTCGKMP